MSDTNELLRDLRDYEYAEGYADALLSAYVATQIKVLREQQGKTQAVLASDMGTTQTVISRIEDVNYSSWSIKTLKRVARALKLRLSVSFESFGTLPGEIGDFAREAMERPWHDQDPEIWSERQGDGLVDPPVDSLEQPGVTLDDSSGAVSYSGMGSARRGPTVEDRVRQVEEQRCQTN